MVRILGFPFVRGGANVLIRRVCGKSLFTRSRSRLNFGGAVRQIYQLHREKHQQNANRNISGAQIQNIEAGKYVESEGEEQHLGRMWRSKRSGQSKKRNNKKLFGKHAFISSNLQQQRSGEQERGTKMMTRIFS